MSTTVELLKPHHGAMLANLFQAADVACHCRWWHFTGSDYDWQLRCATDEDKNRQELLTAVAAATPEAQGIIAHANGVALGWLKLSRPDVVHKVYKRRVYRTLSCFDNNRDQVLVIGCMLVHPQKRRRGLAAELIAGAIQFGESCGASYIEALPRCSKETLRDDELWMAPHSTLVSLGFERVDGPDPYPVMRYTLS